MKKIILSLIATAFIALLPASAFATDIAPTDCSDKRVQYPGYNYIITDYNLKLTVNENNTYQVVEDYSVCFTKPGSHGIYRDIPKKKDLWRANGDVTKNVVTQVSDIKVSGDDFEKSTVDGNIRLKIGNADRTLEQDTLKHYKISYTYNFGPDRLNGVDEFYYNIIGSEWASDVLFLNTDYSIEFPKTIEEDKIGFTHGYTHDSLNGGSPFTLVDDKTILGSYSDPLKGGEALTIRVTLPEGYYQGAAYKTNEGLSKIFIVFSALLAAVIFICFQFYGKDKKLPLYTRYDPPEGMNPVQFGSLVHASDSTNITSLFYHLGEKGYLKIEETKHKNYKIIFLKDYDGDDPTERIFLRSLKDYDTDSNGEVELSQLINRFYVKIPAIKKAAGIAELKKKVYTKSGNIFRVISFLILAVYLIASIIFLISDPYLDEQILALFLIAICFVAPGAAIAIKGLYEFIKKKQEAISAIPTAIAGAIYGGIPLAILAGIDIEFEQYQLLTIATIAITATIIIFCAIHGKKYTEEGRKIMTDVLSYYYTIKNCRPDAEHGFSYFYYTFAFAFAAGLSTAFSKRFKEAISEPPEWYSSTHDITHFSTSSFSSAMRSVSTSSTSSPSSSGGGSGGGGSSGGGGGGGGGGGW